MVGEAQLGVVGPMTVMIGREEETGIEIGEMTTEREIVVPVYGPLTTERCHQLVTGMIGVGKSRLGGRVTGEFILLLSSISKTY